MDFEYDADAMVVGAGIFGATIARALQADGRKVIVFDDARPLSGSAPSGCLMKPSWFSSMGKGVYNPALETLDSLYGVQDLEFVIRPSGLKTKVHWVPNDAILKLSDLHVVRETVVKVGNSQVCTSRMNYLSPLVVVAGGVWSKELIHAPTLVGKQGVSFRIPESIVLNNTIQAWAPYKQAVVFQEKEKEVWAGDGTAIKPENWTTERAQKSLDRMRKITTFASMSSKHAVVGIRPYVPKVKPCLLEEQEAGLWVATGGAKNGLIAAGWAAHEIARKTS